MSHAVPSQVRKLIARLFPDLPKERPTPGETGSYSAARVTAVLDLLDRVPDELIRLTPDDFSMFLANVSALRTAKVDRSGQSDAVRVTPLPDCQQRPLGEIDGFLAKCPDEAPPSQSVGLEFMKDQELRGALSIDIFSANSCLSNHEYKACTVVAGSIIETLLLWALHVEGEAKVRAMISQAPAKALNDWTLGPLIDAAEQCDLISPDTTTQARLAQNYRNLIHPGRQIRLRDRCDRGTALGALAGVERVVTDFRRKYPAPV
jgi:hypothetical protein